MDVMRYELWVFKPGSDEENIASFKSDTPFMTISKGDTFRYDLWIGKDDFKGFKKDGELIVTHVQHVINDTNGLVHQINVFTQHRQVEPQEFFFGD